MSQDAIFAAAEADRWFERNRAALSAMDLSRDLPLRLVELYGIKPRRVLEIGGANGYRVAELMQRTGAEGTVVEPSSQAIADGQARYPKLRYHQGLAGALPVDGPFDLVIANYVLHWVDRSSLLSTAAQIDRVLAEGGYLLIGDFHPWAPVRVRYHHLPEREVFTYKQDYAALFQATGLYQPVAQLSGDGHTLRADVADEQRAAVTLLRKRAQGLYATRDFTPAR